MTLDMAAEYARGRIRYSLNDYIDNYYEGGISLPVEEIAFNVYDKVRQWRQPAYTQKVIPGRALITSRLVFDEIQPFKDELLERQAIGEVRIDERTLHIWFLERLLRYALENGWYWVAVAVLKVIFIYASKELYEVTERLDFKGDPPSEPHIRRWKQKLIDHLISWDRYRDLLKVETVTVGGHAEKHFSMPAKPEENLPFVREALSEIRPPKPDCKLHDKSGAFKLELLPELKRLLEQRSQEWSRVQSSKTTTTDAAEREIMQFLTCPVCLFSAFEALGFSEYEKKLGLPIFIWSGGGGSTLPIASGGGRKTPLNKRGLSKGGTAGNKNFAAAARQRDKRRNKLPLDFVIIAVNNVVRKTITLDYAKTVSLKLQCGESIIEVRGEDDEGSLPLSLHHVSWDWQLNDSQPCVFITKLRGGRRLEFTVTYQRDAEGDLASATVDISYSRTAHLPDSFLTGWKRPSLALACLACLFVLSFRLGPPAYQWVVQRLNQQAPITAQYEPSTTVPAPSPTTHEKSEQQPIPKIIKAHAGDKKPALPDVAANATDAATVDAATIITNSARADRIEKYAKRQPGQTSDILQREVYSRPAERGAPVMKTVSNGASLKRAVAVRTGNPSAAARNAASYRPTIIAGTVTSDGQPLPGARLKISSLLSPGEEVDVKARADGSYVSPNLKGGIYRVKVKAHGFKKYEVDIAATDGKKHQVKVVLVRTTDNRNGKAASSANTRMQHHNTGDRSLRAPSSAGVRKPSTGHSLSRRGIRQPTATSTYRSFSAANPGREQRLATVNREQLIRIRLNSQISSRKAYDGQLFYTTVTKPISAGGVRVIPTGSTIVGEVSRFTRALNDSVAGTLEVRFIELHLPDGVIRPITARLHSTAAKRTPSRNLKERSTSRLPARREMIFIGDEKEGFRLISKNEINRTSGSTKHGARSTQRRAPAKARDAVVKAGKEFYLSLEQNISLPVRNLANKPTIDVAPQD